MRRAVATRRRPGRGPSGGLRPIRARPMARAGARRSRASTPSTPCTSGRDESVAPMRAMRTGRPPRISSGAKGRARTTAASDSAAASCSGSAIDRPRRRGRRAATIRANASGSSTSVVHAQRQPRSSRSSSSTCTPIVCAFPGTVASSTSSDPCAAPTPGVTYRSRTAAISCSVPKLAACSTAAVTSPRTHASPTSRSIGCRQPRTKSSCAMPRRSVSSSQGAVDESRPVRPASRTRS